MLKVGKHKGYRTSSHLSTPTTFLHSFYLSEYYYTYSTGPQLSSCAFTVGIQSECKELIKAEILWSNLISCFYLQKRIYISEGTLQMWKGEKKDVLSFKKKKVWPVGSHNNEILTDEEIRIKTCEVGERGKMVKKNDR